MTYSPLLQMLYLVRMLNTGPTSANTIAQGLQVSDSSVKRLIAEARSMGAEIRSYRSGEHHLYELRNPAHVMPTTRRWIDLEERQSLLSSAPAVSPHSVSEK